jgi:hypothetical protein
LRVDALKIARGDVVQRHHAADSRRRISWRYMSKSFADHEADLTLVLDTG